MRVAKARRGRRFPAMVPWVVLMKVLPAGPGPTAAPGIDAPCGPPPVEEPEAPSATDAPAAVLAPVAVAGPEASAPPTGAEAAFLAAVEADFEAEMARLLVDDPFTAHLLFAGEEP